MKKKINITLFTLLAIFLWTFLFTRQENRNSSAEKVLGYTTSEIREMGYLDVTTYGADPTGVRDSTAAIQQAIDYALSNKLVTYFPNQSNGQRGIYLISNTLKVMYRESPRVACPQERQWPVNILQGSTEGGIRPLLKLKSGVSKFSDPNNPLPVVWMWAKPFRTTDYDPWHEDTDVNFNAIFKGIDIDLSRNPGAIGVQNRGAQGASIEDTKITATGAFAGVRGFGVLGWQISNIEVVGGRYGIYTNHDNSINPATNGTGHGPIIGSTFRGQTSAVFKFVSSPGTTSCIGCHIINAKSPILDTSHFTYRGGFNMVDSVIETQSGSVIPSGKHIYLRDVYIKGASSVVSGWSIGNPSGWTWVKEYLSLASGAPKENLVNGNLNTQSYRSKVESVNVTKTQLVSSLVNKHRWDSKPSFEDTDYVNVKKMGSRSAKGDGVSDDTQALQYAIDNYRKVFLPKGVYLVSNTIVLKSSTQLFGASRVQSHIVPHSNWKPVGEKVVLSTVNDKNATTSMSDLVVHKSYWLETFGENGLTTINWRAGRNSVTWNVTGNGCGKWDPDMYHLVNNYPTYKFTGYGGGRHFGILGRTMAKNTEGKYQRSVLIDGTNEPLYLYGFNHAREPLEQIGEIKNAQNVRIFNPTHEGGKRVYKITNSSDITFVGGHKNGSLRSGLSGFEITNSNNIIVADFSAFRLSETTGEYTLTENYNGVTKRIANDNNVGLFKRGEPSFTSIGDAPPVTPSPYPTGIPTSQPTQVPTGAPTTTNIPPSPSGNILTNPSFEDGTNPWRMHNVGGDVAYSVVSSGTQGSYSAKLTINNPGTQLQFYQSGITLEPNTSYTLSFAAYSNSGHDLSVYVHEHDDDYTNYGLSGHTANLSTSWNTYTTTFTTQNFTGTVNDARLRFWFGPFDEAGDEYFIDNVILAKSQEPSSIPGDANNDGKVDGIDYVIWFTNLGKTTQNGASDGDFNGDTKVDGVDYVIWLKNVLI